MYQIPGELATEQSDSSEAAGKERIVWQERVSEAADCTHAAKLQ